MVELHPPGHHYSARQLLSGTIPKQTARAKQHRVQEIQRLWQTPLAPRDRVGASFVTAYAPLVYAPAALALALTSSLDASLGVQLHAARLASLAVWLLGIWLAIRRCPAQGWLLCATALLPMSVFQAASISADPLTQVVIFLLFAELLRVSSGDATRLSAAGGLGLIGLCLALGLAKPGYSPLALAAFGIPAAAFPARRKWIWATAMLAAAILATLGWAAIAQLAQQPALTAEADLGAQLRHVLAHPLAFAGAVVTTVTALAGVWLDGMIGNLGHLDVELPWPATWLAWAAVLAGAALGSRTLPHRALAVSLGLGFIAAALTILLMAYLGWTPVGAAHIQGVQARYFLLMLPFGIAALPALPNPAGDRLRPAVVWSLATVLGVSAVELVTTYYQL